MKDYICPRCGYNVPGWQPVHLRCLVYRLKWVIVPPVLILLYLLFSMVGKTVDCFERIISDKDNQVVSTKSSIVNNMNGLQIKEQARTEVAVVSIIITPIPSKTLTPLPTKTLIPTKKALPTRTLMPTRTMASTIVVSSCPGAPPQRLLLNEDAKVCTKSEKVALRSGPTKSNSILVRVKAGTVVWVLDGPKCANDWSWWKVELSDGTAGWMSEGGDTLDPYFLCPN
jgi:hypothetical protein